MVNHLKRLDIKPEGAVETYVEILKDEIKRFFPDTEDLVCVSCPICDSNQNDLKYKKFNFDIVTCKSCGFVHVNPRPKVKSIIDYYTNSIASKYFQKNIIEKTMDVRLKKIVIPRFNFIKEICSKFTSNDKLSWLDVGCSTGFLLSLGRETGWKTYGIEFELDAVQLAEKRGNIVYQIPLENLNITNSFDLITMFEVLEHMTDPRKSIESAWRALKNNGLLIMTMPNIDGIEYQILKEYHSNVCPPSHLNYFNIDSLNKLLLDCGYEIVRIDTPGLLDIDNIRAAIKSGAIKSSGLEWMDKILMDDTPYGEELRISFQSLIIDSLQSGNMRVVARKSSVGSI